MSELHDWMHEQVVQQIVAHHPPGSGGTCDTCVEKRKRMIIEPVDPDYKPEHVDTRTQDQIEQDEMGVMQAIKQALKCPQCAGVGWVTSNANWIPCQCNPKGLPPRGKAQKDCPTCGGDGHLDSGGVTPWGAGIDIPCPSCYPERQ